MTFKPKTAAAVHEGIAFLGRFPHYLTDAENEFVKRVAGTTRLASLSYADLERIESLTKKLLKELV